MSGGSRCSSCSSTERPYYFNTCDNCGAEFAESVPMVKVNAYVFGWQFFAEVCIGCARAGNVPSLLKAIAHAVTPVAREGNE